MHMVFAVLGQKCSQTILRLVRSIMDMVELSKPRVTMMVLLVTAAGYYLASVPGKHADYTVLAWTLLGVGLATAGTFGLNQYLERHSDALMERTRWRPLPSRRMSPLTALIVSSASVTAGVCLLLVAVNVWTGILTLATVILYACVYTPLKKLTSLNTFVGAFPGAAPPVLGWVAVRGAPDVEVLPLYLLLFFWQLPHFWSIAWLYRADYRRAGLCMVANDDEKGHLTAKLMVQHSLFLVLISLAPVGMGQAGTIYYWSAMGLGSVFVAAALRFYRSPDVAAGRRVLWISLASLPLVMLALVCDWRGA